MRVWERLKLWVVFLTPFHGIFLMLSAFGLSVYGGLALGACVFVHGEVLWDRRSVFLRKQWFVDLFEIAVEPVFRYFPIVVRRSVTPNEASTNRTTADPIEDRTRGATSPPSPRGVIYGYHPHGIYAFGLFSLVFPRLSGFADVVPAYANGRRSVLVAVASALLHVPVAHCLFSYLGFIPASRKTLESACESDQHDIVLIPGGIAEMLCQQSDTTKVERLYIRKRRGFVRLAISQNRDLVPVFAFGENRTFTQLTWLRDLREYVSRRFRISLQLFHGRWCTLIPYRTPITVVVGRPVSVERVRRSLLESDGGRTVRVHVNRKQKITYSYGTSAPLDEDRLADAVHRAYVEELTRVFESNKSLHPGYEHTELVLL